MSAATFCILLVIGLVAGLFSGMIGIGGGIVIVPALVYFLGMNQHMAQGTSLAMMLLPVGILGVMNYYNKGALDVKAALLLAIPFVVGAFVGSKFILNLDASIAKKIFAGVMMVVAVKMMFFDK
ncbi:MAG: TSUP family transporter [Flavobacteriales bacterium]